jgi:pyruvate dehydrogenase E1 component alpha subunit
VRREKTDPLVRLERYMKNEGMWDDAWLSQLESTLSDEIEAAVKEMENEPAAQVDDMFDHVFAENPWPLEEQKQNYSLVRGER